MPASSAASVLSNCWQPRGLSAAELLGPWGSLGKDAPVGCQTLLQGIFLTQASNPCLSCLLHWQACSSPVAPPGKPVCVSRSVLLARRLEWVAISFSRGSSRPRALLQADSLPSEPPGKPVAEYKSCLNHESISH